MGLYSNWKEFVVSYIENIGQEEFLNEYGRIQEETYPKILKLHGKSIEGALKDLASKFDLTPVIFMGIIDSLNSSLNKPLNLEELNEDTRISLDINFEKLFINMVKIDAINLYTLCEWNIIFPRKYMEKLIQCHSSEKTVLFPKEIKRNSPCPCGSGKKFKHCCGKINRIH